MTPRRGLTLAERSALSAAPPGPAADPGRAAAGVPAVARSAEPAGADTARALLRPRARHCWVRDPPGAPGRWPGLLAEWQPAGAAAAEPGSAPDRTGGRGWLGRVVYAVDDGGGCVLVETWLPAGQLEPADPSAGGT